MDLHAFGSIARWTARILGLAYFVFIAWFVVAHAVSPEGLPSLWKMSPAEQLDTLALFLVVVGGVVGWLSSGLATIMVLFGSVLWFAVERNLLWPPGLSLLFGLLYAFAWWSEKQPFAPRTPAQQ